MAKSKNHHYVLAMLPQPVFVTKINHGSKTALWNKDEKPLEMSASQAEDLAFGLCANLNVAFHVVMPFELDEQPYRYKKGHFEWVWDENEQETEE